MPSILGYLNYPKPYIAFGNNLFDKSSKRFAINYIEESYQFLIGDYAFYFIDNKITGIYNRIKDPNLTQNLLGTKDFSKEETLYKAIIQQFNNRMVEDRLTIAKH